MNIQPIDERILVKPVEQEERKVGSLYIPDTASKERPQIGEVIAVGDDVEQKNETRKKLSELIKIGDRVVFSKYGGTEVKIEEVEHLIIPRNDILAVVK